MQTNARLVYLDSSALIKLANAEPETSFLTSFLEGYSHHVSCDLARVEVVRAARAHGPEAIARAWMVLRRTVLVRLDATLLERAAMLDPASLRSLDAIHIAAALQLAGELSYLISYDTRMLQAAIHHGLTTASPGRR